MWPGFFLLLMAKCKRKDKQMGEMLKETRTWWFGKFSACLDHKNTKIRRYPIKKALLWRKSQECVDNLSSVLKDCTRDAGTLTQPPKQELGSNARLEDLLSHDKSPWDTHRRLKGFWECFISRNTASLAWKGQKENKVKERRSDYQNSTGNLTTNKTTQLKTCTTYPSRKSKDNSKNWDLGPEARAKGPEGRVPGHKRLLPGIATWEIFPAEFETAWDQWHTYSLYLLLFGFGNVHDGHILHVHHCSLGTHNSFSSFPGAQIEIFPQDGSHPESHLYLI